jgi:hypothetical protein
MSGMAERYAAIESRDCRRRRSSPSTRDADCGSKMRARPVSGTGGLPALGPLSTAVPLTSPTRVGSPAAVASRPRQLRAATPAATIIRHTSRRGVTAPIPQWPGAGASDCASRSTPRATRRWPLRRRRSSASSVRRRRPTRHSGRKPEGWVDHGDRTCGRSTDGPGASARARAAFWRASRRRPSGRAAGRSPSRQASHDATGPGTPPSGRARRGELG